MGPKKVRKSESDSTAVEASARMAPPAPVPSVACGRTQKILDDLLEKVREGRYLYEDYFTKDGKKHRCNDCGCTIGQHANDDAATLQLITLADLRAHFDAVIERLSSAKNVKEASHLWDDYSDGWTFEGREAFFDSIASALITVVDRETRKAVQVAYSTRSGAGKTRAMLEIGNKVPDVMSKKYGRVRVVNAYLGFNTCLPLDEAEINRIGRAPPDIHAREAIAREVIARRLLGAVVASLHAPSATHLLPYEDLFGDVGFASEGDCLKLAIEYLRCTPQSRVIIAAGVDEVQLLNESESKPVAKSTPASKKGVRSTASTNSEPTVEVIGWGRLFLRVLRRMQSSRANSGLYVMPIATGVAVDMSVDKTEATMSYLNLDGDAEKNVGDMGTTLISLADFAKLAEAKFKKTPTIAATAALTTIYTIAKWPRVRELLEPPLLQLRDTCGNSRESNRGAWAAWMVHWAASRPIDLWQTTLLPGYGGGTIDVTFQIGKDNTIVVHPDAACSLNMCMALEAELPIEVYVDDPTTKAGAFYNALCLTDKRISELLCWTWSDFEDMAMTAIALSLRVGLAAYSHFDEKAVARTSKLTLASWLHDCGIMCPAATTPVAIGFSAQKERYFPFVVDGPRHGERFLDAAGAAIAKTLKAGRPAFVRCGRDTAFDAAFIFPAKRGAKELVVIVVDAKTSLTTGRMLREDYYVKLVTGATKLSSALRHAGFSVANCLPCIITNAKRRPHETVLTLTSDNFSIPPYSDLLFSSAALGKSNSDDGSDKKRGGA